MSHSEPLNSVVIPALNRAHSVVRAKNSALNQTLNEVEVIVAVDGSDEETIKVLHQIKDSSVKVIPLPVHWDWMGLYVGIWLVPPMFRECSNQLQKRHRRPIG